MFDYKCFKVLIKYLFDQNHLLNIFFRFIVVKKNYIASKKLREITSSCCARVRRTKFTA